MAKARKIFVCQSCGSTTGKWAGQCEACNEWNSIVEEQDLTHPTGLGKASPGSVKGRIIDLSDLQRYCSIHYSRGGAQGVGIATTNAVVSACMLILLSNYIVTEMFFSS